MSHLTVPKTECVESKENYGRFVAEPLEKGFGVTIGNSMRRVLLSQLEGAAVTRVKIEGIQHEFSTVPFVKEDATEFLLNIKAIRLKPLSGSSGKLTLEAEGEGKLTAADIKPSSDFEITNPDQYLATLDSPEAKLYAELEVELGRGYREADATDNAAVGVIPIDAIFSPVRRVNFTVEPIYTGPEANRERLFLEVWTDGTISPTEAISRGAEILRDQLSPFANYTKLSKVSGEGKEPVRPTMSEELYHMPVEQLNLSVRTMNCLRRGGIATVGELAGKTEKELMGLRNFGQKSKQEIIDRLTGLGLTLAESSEEDEEEEE